jgi:hypothetical protein
MARSDSYHRVLQRGWMPSVTVNDRSASVYRKVLLLVPTLAVALLLVTLASVVP